ncbi:hypothetical protein FN976_19310 [Caenimonas sedimenti]|uniref:Uncharacterized protein n=1 Tax=Caenimonas sedimenti TaxID=2596921 RepID=A0A562ZM82_9BURK|nr:hypothetical protein [Caenimonas sedimenti]TWO69438.1 hypothetical protein FN976_19310 [Caenimonas sedimenti]
MPRRTVIKPIVTARKKTESVQTEIQQAESDLHETNALLLETPVGQVTRADVQEAVDRSVKVEEQLHDAAKELEVVTGLLRAAEAAVAPDDAGNRSGEGADSVLRHMRQGSAPDTDAAQ